MFQFFTSSGDRHAERKKGWKMNEFDVFLLKQVKRALSRYSFAQGLQVNNPLTKTTHDNPITVK